ncbi:phosphatidylinositol 3,4,5-trisphosphate 3-phosphatase TPTE2-like [Dreissena polymorpha]|uniref:Phosphatidylinositol-3,4,5-trisphosphate 3-phosphatase n=1 Tax=Dreissena polymorpha TaxID=45954 RepID=A0A9D4KMZ4_DREPO|nr:phosphatidylinositol 3,4,5-trisphosphate 3-phosphatase TPTE2-like [Dreissena polymorpha]KAH3842858.1 hypothetical protein DPMN_116362 [Dreissena polymorpha]
MEYQCLDDGESEIKPSTSAEISPSEVVNVSSTGQIKDTQITVEKSEGTGTLTFYDAEKQKGLDYIDDPSATPALTGVKWVQSVVQSVLEHIAFRISTVLLIILDLTLVIIDLADISLTANFNSGLEIVSHIIISIFMLEILMRIFYMGERFFRTILDLVDGIIVLASFVLDMIFVCVSKTLVSAQGTDYAKLIAVGRVFRIIRIVRIVYFMYIQRRHVSTATRKVISENKRRYMKDGFDLDLCYVTERVIAMSFPSSGIMALYRNDIRDVARFFNTKHPDHYRIYNLCSEMDHKYDLFYGRVERIYIDDHNVPTVQNMIDFCKNAREFMAADKRNIIALHCKGGKGRTGTLVCVWLVDCGMFDDAKESLDYFGDRRTDLSVGSKFQGVETPSQSRFVGYYEKVKKMYNCELPPRTELKITSFKIESIAGVGNGDGSDLGLELRAEGLLIFEAKVAGSLNCECTHDRDNDSITITLKDAPVIANDVKVRFISTSRTLPSVYDHCAFFFWFHTSFIENNKLRLERGEIDNPHKVKSRKVFRDTFAIEVNFEVVAPT